MKRACCALCFATVTILLGGCAAEDSRPAATLTRALPTIARPALAPVESPSPSPSPAAEARTYAIRPGDTLSSIAEQYYGDAAEWRLIFEANRDRLTSPGSLQVGVTIRIPPRPQTATPSR